MNPAPSPVVEGTWDKLLISTARLMKMVIEGAAVIIGDDDFGRHVYRTTQAQLDAYRTNDGRPQRRKVSSSGPASA